MMRFWGAVKVARAALVALVLVLWAGGARAQALIVTVDLSDQLMEVRQNGQEPLAWPVSTARAGKCTPVGEYTPYLLKRMHYSTLYDYAPMPFSIFFSGNYAIHGTTQVDRLGSPASAGCIRLAPEHAEILFNMVLDIGKVDTRIVIRE
jgi:lipoprotein-anchoring transpeptidase ErfK/SrfK